MGDLDDGRGVLYPGSLPAFHRRAVPEPVAHLARWYWIARWDLSDGVVSTQSLLPFPAANLVVEPRGIGLSGPTTAASERALTGRGWAFGVLLRAAGLAVLDVDPGGIVDAEVGVSYDDLAAGVTAAMDAHDSAAAARVMSQWWSRLVGRDGDGVPEGAVLADMMVEIVASDPGRDHGGGSGPRDGDVHAGPPAGVETLCRAVAAADHPEVPTPGGRPTPA